MYIDVYELKHRAAFIITLACRAKILYKFKS